MLRKAALAGGARDALAAQSERRIARWLAIILAALACALFLWYGLSSAGTYQDDDIAHFMIARFSWKHPALLANTWGRPAFTILYSPAAQFGFSAVRVFSALLATATCVLAAQIARLCGVRWYWLAIPLTALQPEFLRQAFSALTELSFAFYFCIALMAYRRHDALLMALAAGLLPLARYETLPLLVVFASILIQWRQPRLLPLLAAPFLAQNGVNAALQHDPSVIFFPLTQVLGRGPANAIFDYGTGDGLYYVRSLPVAYGGIPFLLACWAIFMPELGLLKVCTLVVVAVLSLTYWLVPAAGVAGFVRHLAVAAPAVGVLAAAGIERLGRPRAAGGRRWALYGTALLLTAWLWIRGMQASAAAGLCFLAIALWVDARAARGILPGNGTLAAVASGAILLALAGALVQVRPFPASPEQAVLVRAADWYAHSDYRLRPVLGSHIRFQFLAGLDPYDELRYRPVTPANLGAAPRGAIVVWDSHYSHRLVWNTPLTLLQDTLRFRELRSWKDGGFSLHIFEKLAD